MEVEPVPYIFGSFTRRRPSHAHSHSDPSTGNFDQRKLPDPQPSPDGSSVRVRHAHSRSQPETGHTSNTKQLDSRALRTRSCTLTLKPRSDKALLTATCPVCNHVFLEPRVLECLHSFCTRCLQDIVDKNRDRGEVWFPRDDHTGIETVINNCVDGEVDVNHITCPVCTERTPLSRHGVLGLPPDYVVQHRLVLATLNDENTRLLCDLCTGDVVAIERCSQCLVNVCAVCSAMHRRHARTAQHELLRLREVRRRGLMRIHRHLMCHVHPEHELRVYCTTCEQPACPLCISLHHAGHRCTSCPGVAAAQGGRLRRLLGRARGAAARDQALRRRLAAARCAVTRRCQAVADQVEQHVDEYRRVVERQRERLLGEIETIRSSLFTHLSTFESSLSTRLQSSSTTINFSQALLEEGSDVELLTFVSTLLKKLEDLEQPVKITEELKELLKQTARDRISDQDGLVDFVPQNSVKDLELEKCERNFDAFQRPIRHVLVDFVPNKEEINIGRKNHCDLKEDVTYRKSVSSNESARSSKTIQEVIEDTSKTSNHRKCNSMNIVIEESDTKNSSLKRKSNNLSEQKLEEVTSKPSTGILNQLKNCLDNHEDKKTVNKLSKLEDTSKNLPTKTENFKLTSSTETLLPSHSSIESLSHSESSDEINILEFLPLEPEICAEGTIPVVFGQIRRLTSSSTDGSNCCSASRPHLGGNPNLKSKTCCGQTEQKGTTKQSNRNSDATGKLYQITI